jgi:predicted nucleic acid-binding protein
VPPLFDTNILIYSVEREETAESEHGQVIEGMRVENPFL